MGLAEMYNISATFATALTSADFDHTNAVTATRRIGFRHVVLVTVNDSDVATVASARSQEGNGDFTLMLRLNGAPVFGRG